MNLLWGFFLGGGVKTGWKSCVSPFLSGPDSHLFKKKNHHFIFTFYNENQNEKKYQCLMLIYKNE